MQVWPGCVLSTAAKISGCVLPDTCAEKMSALQPECEVCGPTRNTPGSPDPQADYAELAGKGIDVDAEIMGGDGMVPALFFFRGLDKNQLMIVAD